MALTLPILAKVGLISVAVKYIVDKYTDDSVSKAEDEAAADEVTKDEVIKDEATKDEVTKETINIQKPQTPDEGQSLLGKTCIENRRRILSLMEDQKKLVPGDAHKLLKEECAANKDSISSLTTDLRSNNNAMIDSIAAINKKADGAYRTCAGSTRSANKRFKDHHGIMETHIKNTMDRSEFTYGDDSLFAKDIKKELTVMEEALNTSRRN